MRSRIIWTKLASSVVLIGIALMHFSLSALQGFGELETPDHIWDLVNYLRTLPAIRKKAIQRSTKSVA